MNEQDNAPLESPSGDSDTPPPMVDVHADCVTKLADQQVTIAELRGEIDRLRYTQIMGDDHRLADFWAKAQELAERANHCEIFDDMVEALGGPRRRKNFDVDVSFTVTIPVSYTISVDAVDEEEAIESAIDMVAGMDASDFQRDAMWYAAEMDDDSFNGEVN